MLVLRTYHLPGLLCALCAILSPRHLLAQDSLADVQPTKRIIRSFDFDERDLGNLEPVPMLWTQHRATGFPQYTEGQFDEQMGHLAEPSFYLSLNGRSCAYLYTGLDIPFEPHSEYRVAAHIRPDRLTNARAYVSVFLMDANGMAIPSTELRSRLVGGNPGADSWEQVVVRLPGDQQTAYAIGLGVWVVQRLGWRTAGLEDRDIDHVDVQGGAWFDDLAVYRLPSIELSSSASEQGNVYPAGETPELLVRVGELSSSKVKAHLVVRNASGAVVREQDIRSRPGRSAQGIELPDLEPGLYYAQLAVEVEPGAAIERRLTFASLPPRLSGASGGRFGIILEPNVQPAWQAHARLLALLKVNNVKVVVPSGQARDPSGDRLLHDLAERKVVLTGTFGDFASPDARRAQSMVDLFSKPTEAWQPQVASAVTRYESLFSHWQFGMDGESMLLDAKRLGRILDNLRVEMSRLTTMPQLIAPWSVHQQPGLAGLPAEGLSVEVPRDVLPAEIPAHLESTFSATNNSALWAVVEALPEQRYHRLPRLADFAKRLIYAHQSSAERIFVRQPWATRTMAGQRVTEPSELYLAYRTVVALLDDASYLGELKMAEGVACHVFDRRGQAVMAMWAEDGLQGDSVRELHLAGANQMVDLWGRNSALTTQQDLAAITLSALPVFVYPGETWLVQFRQGLRFDPVLLPSDLAFHQQELLVHNPRSEPISGSIKMKSPQGWQIRPTQFAFGIPPGGTLAKKIRIQAAVREPAGVKHITTEVVLDAVRLYEFDVQLPLELNLADMHVWADMVREGEALVLRHGVTNRSDETVTFNSFADAPGRKRHNLAIQGLQPNQTVVKAHHFPAAADLAGQQIRIGLRQVKGPRSHNLLITVP